MDTCAAEFSSETPYHYSTWEDENEVLPSEKPKVIILGAGPSGLSTAYGIKKNYAKYKEFYEKKNKVGGLGGSF